MQPRASSWNDPLRAKPLEWGKDDNLDSFFHKAFGKAPSRKEVLALAVWIMRQTNQAGPSAGARIAPATLDALAKHLSAAEKQPELIAKAEQICDGFSRNFTRLRTHQEKKALAGRNPLPKGSSTGASLRQARKIETAAKAGPEPAVTLQAAVAKLRGEMAALLPTMRPAPAALVAQSLRALLEKPELLRAVQLAPAPEALRQVLTNQLVALGLDQHGAYWGATQLIDWAWPKNRTPSGFSHVATQVFLLGGHRGEDYLRKVGLGQELGAVLRTSGQGLAVVWSAASREHVLRDIRRNLEEGLSALGQEALVAGRALGLGKDDAQALAEPYKQIDLEQQASIATSVLMGGAAQQHVIGPLRERIAKACDEAAARGVPEAAELRRFAANMRAGRVDMRSIPSAAVTKLLADELRPLGLSPEEYPFKNSKGALAEAVADAVLRQSPLTTLGKLSAIATVAVTGGAVASAKSLVGKLCDVAWNLRDGFDMTDVDALTQGIGADTIDKLGGVMDAHGERYVAEKLAAAGVVEDLVVTNAKIKEVNAYVSLGLRGGLELRGSLKTLRDAGDVFALPEGEWQSLGSIVKEALLEVVPAKLREKFEDEHLGLPALSKPPPS